MSRPPSRPEREEDPSSAHGFAGRECTTGEKPVRFWGRVLTSDKQFVNGTHRVVDPAATVEMVRPYLKTAGVTRVADVTGLDRVGVPTTLAIRPNSLTIACSSGKGVTLEQAYASGCVEAIELHAAETAALPSVRGSYNELRQHHAVPAEEDLPLTLQSLYQPDWPFHWHEAWDLISESTLMIPLAVVGMSRTQAHLASVGAFQVSSNGLGGGNTLVEAVTSGLYEVVERDAMACHALASLAGPHQTPVVPRAVLDRYELVADVLDKCDHAGVSYAVYDCTADTNVPTYSASIYDRLNQGIGVVRGSGAHLDPGIAMLRAVTEALQARLNFIAGSRDDIFRSAFRRFQVDWELAVARIEQDLATAPEAPARASGATHSFESDIREVIRRLQRVGRRQVAVVDLTPPECPVYVVRVIVPGLEGYMHHGYRPGHRALKFAEKVVEQCA